MKEYKNYDFLMKNLKANDEQELLEIIDNRVDSIVKRSLKSESDTVKALICLYESKSNFSDFYSAMAIIYAILAMALASFLEIAEYTVIKCVLCISFAIATIVLLAFMSGWKKQIEYKTFILSALRMRYDALNKQSDSCNKTEKVNE